LEWQWRSALITFMEEADITLSIVGSSTRKQRPRVE